MYFLKRFYYGMALAFFPNSVQLHLDYAQAHEQAGEFYLAYELLEIAVFQKKLKSLWLFNNMSYYALQLIKDSENYDLEDNEIWRLMKIIYQSLQDALKESPKEKILQDNWQEFAEYCQTQGTDTMAKIEKAIADDPKIHPPQEDNEAPETEVSEKAAEEKAGAGKNPEEADGDSKEVNNLKEIQVGDFIIRPDKPFWENGKWEIAGVIINQGKQPVYSLHLRMVIVLLNQDQTEVMKETFDLYLPVQVFESGNQIDFYKEVFSDPTHEAVLNIQEVFFHKEPPDCKSVNLEITA